MYLLQIFYYGLIYMISENTRRAPKTKNYLIDILGCECHKPQSLVWQRICKGTVSNVYMSVTKIFLIWPQANLASLFNPRNSQLSGTNEIMDLKKKFYYHNFVRPS